MDSYCASSHPFSPSYTYLGTFGSVHQSVPEARSRVNCSFVNSHGGPTPALMIDGPAVVPGKVTKGTDIVFPIQKPASRMSDGLPLSAARSMWLAKVMRDVTSALPRSKPGIFNPQKSCKTCLAIERCGSSTRPRFDLDPDPTPPDSTHSRR